MVESLSALQGFLEKEFEGAYYVKTRTVSVGAAATPVVPNDFERLGLVIINLSSSNLYLAPGPDVSPTAAIILTGSGSTASLNARNDLVLVGYGWYAISAVPPANVYTLEVLRYRT